MRPLSARYATAALVLAGTLLAGVVLDGCSKAGDATAAKTQGPSSTADLRAAADLSACPAPRADATGDHLLPDIALPCLGDGPAVPLRQLTGTPTVLNLWATWCAPCRKELPTFQKAFTAADPRKLRILGVVSEDPDVSAPLSFAADTGLHMPSLVDTKGRVRQQVGAPGLPGTVLLGADGSVAHLYVGPPLGYDDLRDLVARYLHVRLDG